MKALSFLFGNLSEYACTTVCNGKSAVQSAVDAAMSFPCTEQVVLCVPSIPDGCNLPDGCTVAVCPEWTKTALLNQIGTYCNGVDHVYVAPADAPFLDVAAATQLWDQHIEYAAEYSFADGYPFGFFPEIAASGIIPILQHLSSTEDEKDQKSGLNPSQVTRNTLFSLLQIDINSFDIETDIAPVDLRQLRLEFLCDSKRNLLLCSRFESAGIRLTAKNVFSAVQQHLEFLRTLPAFYYVQTTATCPHQCPICPYPVSAFAKKARNMSLDDFNIIVQKAVNFSGDAVISPSLWGEPSLNQDMPQMIRTILSYPSASVLIETTGIGWSDNTLDEIATVVKNAVPRTNGKPPIEFIISLDAVSDDYYAAAHPGASLSQALSCTEKLMNLFPGCVWPQMVRTKQNEDHLESFYRFWKDKLGQVIIQKYDNFCGQLPELKTADLSPVVRNVCWHLKRDMIIFSDGSVLMCREHLSDDAIVGNAVLQPYEMLWAAVDGLYADQCAGSFNGLCRMCDEYYTFNF